MTTRIHVQFGTALIGVMILVCPGNASDGKARSRFAGSYSGKYVGHNVGGEDQEGTMTSTVDEKGNITGEATNTTLNQTVKLTGTIDEDGKVKMVYEFPNATFTATGTASKTRKGTIIGTLIQWSGMRAMSAIEFESIPKR
jgi:Flp pilus assembly protein TadG